MRASSSKDDNRTPDAASRLRVVERVDPAAAAALWRIVLGDPVPETNEDRGGSDGQR